LHLHGAVSRYKNHVRKLWGVAVSHYQVEGHDECDWSAWERAGRARGEPCGAAVDSWSRYECDADLARSIGANAFRFSVSWSRIERNPRHLERYVAFVDHMNAIGLEPVVTLFHYTHPADFHLETPWTSPAAVDRFARFADQVARAFGSRVRFYVPLNEPLVFLLAGYFDGQIPPGLSDTRSLSRVLDHLLAAHVAAASAIRAHSPNALIGIAHNMMAFAPERRWHPFDRLLVRTAHRSYNRGLIDAFGEGKWKFLLPPATIIKGRRPELTDSLDVFGVNFYSRLHIRFPGKTRVIGDFTYRDRGGRGLTDNGWEIVPEALPAMVREAATLGKPVVITENGLADANDRFRAQFIRDHVRGLPVHGYFHWSLIDNYEWLDGYAPKFGLCEVDRTTMERRPRPSAEVFRQLGREFLAS
jgi:beta-glucosidase